MRRFPRCVALGLVAAAVGAALGCGTSDIPVLLVVGGADAGAGADVGVEAQGPLQDAGPPGTLPYCSTTGPPALVDATDGGSICPDQLAQRAFRYALCLCNNYVSDHALMTDAFDGSNGPYAQSTAIAGGSVGVNGDLHPTGLLQINGSLWASNSTDITTSTVQVSGELHAQGELHPSPMLVVQADAWMASGIQTMGDVTVTGTLHVPAGEPTDVSGTFNHGPIDGTSFPPLLPACDCASSDFVDIAGVVATYAAHNDDAALGISSTVLENVQSDTSMNLPCGRIFLTRIGANAPVHLTAQGHVALFVGGDLSTTSDFEIDAPAGSDIDLFVGGSVTVTGLFQVGSPSNPARARTYVGGSTVNLQNAATLAGNLYAPDATITLGGTAPTTLYGSIFAKGLSSGSDLTIHYDEAILTPSSTPACAEPSTCATCNDCNGQACNSGMCGSCAESSQCCPPLICNGGTCVAVIPR
jgi:hypothetical protein